MLEYKLNLYMELEIIICFKIRKLALIFQLILKMEFEIKLNKYLKTKKV